MTAPRPRVQLAVWTERVLATGEFAGVSKGTGGRQDGGHGHGSRVFPQLHGGERRCRAGDGHCTVFAGGVTSRSGPRPASGATACLSPWATRQRQGCRPTAPRLCLDPGSYKADHGRQDTD